MLGIADMISDKLFQLSSVSKKRREEKMAVRGILFDLGMVSFSIRSVEPQGILHRWEGG